MEVWQNRDQWSGSLPLLLWLHSPFSFLEFKELEAPVSVGVVEGPALVWLSPELVSMQNGTLPIVHPLLPSVSQVDGPSI